LWALADIIRTIKSRRMGWARHVTHKGAVRNAYNSLAGKPKGKRPLGRPRRKWENNMRLELRKLGWESVDWIHRPQDRDQWQAA
jgi:hypothetical protein